VEVIKRALAEEERMRAPRRAAPGSEARLAALRIHHVQIQEVRLIGLQVRIAPDLEIPVRELRGAERCNRRGRYEPRTVTQVKSWKLTGDSGLVCFG
jgi:hypothetical protein